MLEGRFQSFFEEVIDRRPEFDTLLAGRTIYKKYHNEWFTATNVPVLDTTLRSRLEQSLIHGEPWRARRSSEVFFAVPSLSAIVLALFHSRPRRATYDKVQIILEDCLRISDYRFNATHHSKTGLPNQLELESRLNKFLTAGTADSGDMVLAGTNQTQLSEVHIFALDVDHFKQCNDSYGHQFGDLVLQTIGRRLKTFEGTLRELFPSIQESFVAHPHGEEFFLVISGQLPKADLSEIGNRIRKVIKDTPTPTDSEWVSVPEITRDISLPPITERQTTVSVGIASTATRIMPVGDLEDRAEVSRLLEHADSALYRAKAGGRDTVRHYSDILTHCGAVIEHHAETDIVVVDIGTLVGVQVGQEFKVYHPDFVGTKPFYVSDGRSRRKLGSYPRLSCGHIEVIEAQRDLSFCRTIAKVGAAPFAVGSTLEAVPLGSIAHLLNNSPSASLEHQGDILKPEELQAYVDSICQEILGDGAAACVFAIEAPDVVLKDRGSAFVNSSLAKLYTSITELFLPLAKIRIGQIDQTSIAAVWSSHPPVETETAARKVVQHCETSLGGKIRFCVGIYDPSIERKAISGDNSNLDPSKALAFAMYAASSDGRSNSSVQVFSPLVASRILAGARTRKKYDQALKDYADFQTAGVRYCFVENTAGLCALEGRQRDVSFARERFATAKKLKNDDAIFSANLGLTEYMLGNFEAAHLAFGGTKQAQPQAELSEVYRPARALAAYESYKLTGTPSKEFVKAVFSKIGQGERYHFVSPSAIEAAQSDIATWVS
ncbi:GGDEF domain-containing protein [Solimonas terrae]|uniref:GGDEF domain-containing protein n=1 Tax=Solimonas terrae TaxID=1396819 RepID=A0A6M2BPY6_9GAMM|nr:GGDEF domain-containing protein [Solimonas terrae]NGY04137.1 GGDEF domain-containing protein [Solimonas terrae]